MEWSELVKLSFEYVWVIPLLPLLAFILIILDRASAKLSYKELFPKKEIVAYLVVGATALGLILSLIIFTGSLQGHEQAAVNYPWLNAGNLTLYFGWVIDNLSIMMLLVVTFVSMLIQIYTHGYMEKDPGYRLFYAYLALFNFSMLGLVLSTNLFQIYIFWELVGLCSYLLIGFWTDRPSAAQAAKKAFIVNRIGDSLFLIGIVSFLFYTFNYWVLSDNPFLSFAHLPEAVANIEATPFIFGAIAICLFFGAIAKSAQVPLHTWLPDAMEGPTPISALIHAATMVAAGVFLVARIYPILEAAGVLNFVAWIGALTVFIAATIAVTQTDIKRVLAYSTCSQLGYMIFAMGIGAYSAGLFHLCTHAFFKAMLFLCSGAVIIGLHHEQDMRYMGGLRKYMPITAITYLIGAFSISGILLSGFFSKDLILGKALDNITTHGGNLDYNAIALFALTFISAGLTAFYMFRSYFMTFEGEYRGHSKPHEPSKVMTTPLIILAVPSAIFGLIVAGPMFGIHFPDFTAYIHYGEHHTHHPDYGMMFASILIALAGTLGAVSLYWDKYKSADPDYLKKKFEFFYDLSFNKWYFDEVYYWGVRKIFMAGSALSAMFDKYVIDEIVNLLAQITKELGATFKYIQNGKVQFSALVMYTGLIVISIVLVVYAMM